MATQYGRHRNPKGPEVSREADDTKTESAAGRLFDLRWLIAAMFVVYGIVLIVVGILDGQAEIKKAAGVRINLWTGIGMLVLGIVFAVWARLRPLQREE